MNQKRIYLCLAHMSGNEMKYIQEAFDTNWVVPLGPNVNGFEADLKAFAGEPTEFAPSSPALPAAATMVTFCAFAIKASIR